MIRWPLKTTDLSRPRGVLLAAGAGLLLAAAGCSEEPRALRLDDLDEGERIILEKLIVLERAKAGALVDRDRGEAVLDSLAVAWGDSVLEETLAGAPRDATRAKAVGEIFARVLRAEHDSLLVGDGLARLAAPLPDPAPPEPETPEE